MKALLIIAFLLAGGEALLAQNTAVGGGYSSLSMINDYDKKAKNGVHFGIWYNSDDNFFVSGMVYLTLPSHFAGTAPGVFKNDPDPVVLNYNATIKSNLTLFDFNYGRYLIGDFTDNFGVYTSYGVALSYYTRDYDLINPLYTKPADFSKSDNRSRDILISGGLGADYAPHSRGKLNLGIKLYLPLLHASNSSIGVPYFLDLSLSYKYFLQKQ